MRSQWLQYAVLRTASLVAPRAQRAELVKEWQSELWYVPRCGATRFCLGAFRDALWLRQNNPTPQNRSVFRLGTPLQCLTVLAALTAVAILLTIRVPHAWEMMGPSPSASCPSALSGITGLLIFYLPLLAVPFLRGNFPANPLGPWAIRLRHWTFLALKIALILPAVQSGLVVMILNRSRISISQLFVPACILVFRWIFVDQEQRCPTCLRLLTDPVRIGTSSRTFLEWYGAESTCPLGHGLLHTSEMPASYSGRPQWLRLDESWSGLFPERGRQS